MNKNQVKARKSDCASYRVSLFQSVLFLISSEQQTNGSNTSIKKASCLSTQRVLHIDLSLVCRLPCRTSEILFSRASFLFGELKKKWQTLSAVFIVFLISAIEQLLTTQIQHMYCIMCIDCLGMESWISFAAPPAFSSHGTSSIVCLPTKFACRKLQVSKKLEDMISNSTTSDIRQTFTKCQEPFFNSSSTKIHAVHTVTSNCSSFAESVASSASHYREDGCFTNMC